MRSPIVDQRLTSNIKEHWPSRCTIQQITYTTTASRQKLASGATNIPGLINLPCSMGPMVDVRPTDTEVRTTSLTSQKKSRQLKLSGVFPQIVPTLMQAVVDGQVFPIWGVEQDSQGWSMRLRLEIVTPS